ncbi:hypothetical protein [Streptomyces sp. NPDC046821]|uniref:hypothetical protein n=1 Tax=Streptomyces sp. NPDC046821 TaxID=3154702 RepID=UPI0033FB0A42
MNPAELLLAMRDLRIAAGQPSLRDLGDRAAVPGGGGSYLPRTTIGNVLSGKRACTDVLLLHFVKACGVTRESEIQQWKEAWKRAYQPEGVTSRYGTAC